jgi:WD40 repeat protein
MLVLAVAGCAGTCSDTAPAPLASGSGAVPSSGSASSPRAAAAPLHAARDALLGGDDKKALAALERALVSDPGNVDALLAAAELARRGGRDAAAKDLGARARARIETLFGKLEGSRLRHVIGEVKAMAFAPDGLALAIADSYGITVLDTLLWTQRLRLSTGSGLVSHIAFRPDGAELAAAGDEIVVWDAKSGRRLRVIPAPAKPLFPRLRYSPDGAWLAYLSFDKLHLFPQEGAGAAAKTQHWEGVNSVAFDGAQRRLAIGKRDRTIAIHALGSFEAQAKLKLPADLPLPVAPAPDILTTGDEDPRSGVRALAFTPDGATLAASADGAHVLYDVAGAKVTRRFDAQAGQSEDSELGFVDGGNALLDHRGRLWDLRTGTLRRLAGDDRKSWVVADAEGLLFAWSVSRDVRVMRLDDKAARTVAADPSRYPNIALDAHGTHLAVSHTGEGEALEVWTLAEGRFQRMAPAVRAQPAVAIDERGSMVAAARGHDIEVATLADRGGRGGVRTWRGHDDDVTALAFVAGGAQLVSGGQNGTLRFWSVAGGTTERSVSGAGEPVQALAGAPRDARVAAGYGDGSIAVIDSVNGQSLRRLETGSHKVWRVWFSDDGQLLRALSASSFHEWSLADGSERRRRELDALDAAMTVDATLVATVGQAEPLHDPDESTIAVWPLDGSRPRVELPGPLGRYYVSATHERAALALIAGTYGQIAVVNLRTAKAVATLYASSDGGAVVRADDGTFERLSAGASALALCRHGAVHFPADVCADKLEKPGLLRRIFTPTPPAAR